MFRCLGFGVRVSLLQGFRVSGFQGFRVSGFQGFRCSGLDENGLGCHSVIGRNRCLDATVIGLNPSLDVRVVDEIVFSFG